MASPMTAANITYDQYDLPFAPCSDNDYAIAMNKMWTLICAGMIMSMQVGFAFLEAGCIRKKNWNYVFYKLMIHSLFGTLGFWLTGYAFAFGDADINSFIGGERFFAGDRWEECAPGINEITQYAAFNFSLPVCLVVIAITNGSISERTSLVATTIHAFLMSAFIYPVGVAWTWGGGWLVQNGYEDFTGSGVVHCVGAFAGLAGMIVVGPRYNKWGKYESIFDDDKEKENPNEMKGIKSIALDRIPVQRSSAVSEPVQELKQQISSANISRMRKKQEEDEYESFGPSNLTFLLFGGLFLWLGFIFFNAGSTLSMYRSGITAWYFAELAAVNTFTAGCGAGLLCLLVKTPLMGGWNAPRHLKEEAASVCNAFLAGMVANGAGMNYYEPWASFTVGIIGCIFYMLLCKLFDVLQIDDAVEAFQLHGGAGTAGVLCFAYFNHHNGIYYGNTTAGEVFGTQLMGWACYAAWSFFISLLIWTLCRMCGILRVDLKTEVIGWDFVEFADDISFEGRTLKKAGGKKIKTEVQSHHH